MSARQVLNATGDTALQLLRLTAATADVFPPLKSAAGGVLHIAELVIVSIAILKLGIYVQAIVVRIIQSLAQTEVLQTNLRDKLVKLDTTIKQVLTRIQLEKARPSLSRFSRFTRDPDMIAEMRKEIDDAMSLFELEAIAMTEINVQKTLDAVVLNSRELSGITTKVTSLSQNVTLDKLRYIHGVSWDLYRVCLANTRVDIINDALSWVYKSNSQNEAQILLLTAVAGAGKSTIAHTFAERCAEKGLLASSFFFDKETAGRNSPAGLFSTIAAGLSGANRQLAVRIASAIESDQDLPRAPISRQFEELVMIPALGCTVNGPLVIVIDALDEGWSHDLVTILQNRIPRLPGAFRIFVTSRMRPELEPLRRQRHVTSMSLDVTSQSNMQDITLFVSHKLKELADIRALGKDWPGEQLRNQFEKRAEGLFLWVTTVCEYLRKEPYPTQRLQKLVSEPGQATRSAEMQMDKLYAVILDSCYWENEDFVFEYHRIIGAAIATKTPVTIAGLNALFHDEKALSSHVLQQLSPLLTGTAEEDVSNQPLRVLHQSFRNFLVLRAAGSAEYIKFHVVERDHSHHFALLCLETMNRDLNESIIGTGYLEEESLGIPSIHDQQIPEALWYACRFWIDHLLDVGSSNRLAIEAALQQFIDGKAIFWMQLMTAKGQFRGLREVRMWCNENKISKDTTDWRSSAVKHAAACLLLSARLKYENRREEALASGEEAVELDRQIAADRLDKFNPDLAQSLTSLSTTLSGLGRHEEALAVIQESVVHRRQLAADRPDASNAGLAESLNGLSTCLSSLGRHEEALAAIQESLAHRRQLAADRPDAFSADLAQSLNNVSVYLSSLGRHKEALEAIQESVAHRRQLAADRPDVFNVGLAQSLDNLSNRLASLDQHEEALEVVQESVALYRKLAAERPAAFDPGLAQSLNSLSVCLASLDRYEEALATIQESVALFRTLAADRPDAFNAGLSQSLNGLSSTLLSLGQYEEALAVTQESVALDRQLAADRPAAFHPDLANSLNNLSIYLSDLGRHEEALAAIQESVALFRKLAADRPDVFNVGLAQSLDNLSIYLSDLGRHEEALAAIQESVALFRKLAADRPDVFNVGLAQSLDNLSSRLSSLGQHEEALAAVQESVALFRNLAADRPAMFNPKLANSLNDLSVHLSDLGRHKEALAPIQESITLFQSLAADRPAAFNPNLALSLNTLSSRLSSLGQHEEALTAIKESAALYQKLAADRPAAFNPELTNSLNNLSVHLSDLGRHDEALAPVQESVALCRQLAADQPAAFNPALAQILNSLSRTLSGLDRHEEALASVQESVALFRKLAADRPAAFNSDLAENLYNLSHRLTKLDQREEALAAVQESVELYREVAKVHPTIFIPKLSDSLKHLSECLKAADRLEEASAVMGEAESMS